MTSILCVCKAEAVKKLVILHGYEGLSEPSLFTNAISTKIACAIQSLTFKI